MAKLWLWDRTDDAKRPPRVIAVGSLPPGPGLVYEVEAPSSDEARAIYARSKRELPDVSDAALEKLTPGKRKEVRIRHAAVIGDRECVRLVDLEKEAARGPFPVAPDGVVAPIEIRSDKQFKIGEGS